MLESEGVQPVVGHLSVISAPISLSFHPIPQYQYLYLSCAFPASNNLPDYLLVGKE